MDIARRAFSIHGDNIVECERTLDLVVLALAEDVASIRGPIGSPTNPSFEFHLSQGKGTLTFVFFPGFGRWNEDIRQLIRVRGGNIREVPDVILSEVTSGQEHPSIAMEYSGALSAGNQAWQRNGRAYSLGRAQIPYLYVAELGGYELDATRARRSLRLPNPAVPFSYLSYTSSQETPVLPVFVPNPGISEDARDELVSSIGEQELVEFIRTSILQEDVQTVTETLQDKALNFIRQLASSGQRGRTLTPEQWAKAHEAVMSRRRNALIQFLLNQAPLHWSKTAYITRLTGSAKELMRIAGTLSIGLTSINLPMCVVPANNRTVFAQEVKKLYSKINGDFVNWLENREPLVIVWVMGFKPRGDDARPDRGLPPFARMLVGPDADVLTVIYGPAPEAHWPLLMVDPQSLASQNGLWEAIMATSNAILVDSATDGVTDHGFLQQHWASAVDSPSDRQMLVEPVPQRIGEHDVDTVIHTIFARLGAPHVFEGLCNPPGGDWSGISLLTSDKRKELRWLSLPRVSGRDAKRPDHVLQLFGISRLPIVLAIESKERANSVESRIGPRLKNYLSRLFSGPASIERDDMESVWRHTNASMDQGGFQLASAAAFLGGRDTVMSNARQRAEADLQICLYFTEDNSHCEVQLFPTTSVGQAVAEFVSGLPTNAIGVSVHVC